MNEWSIYMAGAIALGALAIVVTPTASVAGVAVAMGEIVRSPEMARHGCMIRGLLRAGVADFRERGGASRTISGFGICRRWTMRSVLIELLAVAGLAFRLNRVVMANFVYPSYFEVFRKAGSDQFDYLNRVHRPFRLLQGGYQIVLRNGKKHFIYDSKRTAKRFRQEDRRDRRSKQARPPASRRLSGSTPVGTEAEAILVVRRRVRWLDRW